MPGTQTAQQSWVGSHGPTIYSQLSTTRCSLPNWALQGILLGRAPSWAPVHKYDNIPTVPGAINRLWTRSRLRPPMFKGRTDAVQAQCHSLSRIEGPNRLLRIRMEMLGETQDKQGPTNKSPHHLATCQSIPPVATNGNRRS